MLLAGDAWVQLLAKLMVSSEEVAASVLSRQPSGERACRRSQHLLNRCSGRAAAVRLCVHGLCSPVACLTDSYRPLPSRPGSRHVGPAQPHE